MTLPVLPHPRVERALESAYQWWAKHHSPLQAARWFNGFLDALRSLSDNPHRCPLAIESDKFPFELRQMNFGLGAKPTHRALFTIRPDMVFVLMIRHLAQEPITPEDLD